MSNYCIYCTVPFGSYVKYKGETRATTSHRDHFIAKCQGGEYISNNLVDACNICNQIKTDKIFENGTEAKAYILEQLIKGEFQVIVKADVTVKLEKKYQTKTVKIINTTPTKCPMCNKHFQPKGNKHFCSGRCKQRFHRMDKVARGFNIDLSSIKGPNK